ncbi:hypothetical protein BO94DRAFT_381087 [Aspergillus sclerotioniger CBS 115572]|uniref:RED-like N-terminal domain-containing protein n=1 Tax=Aspergillus sclerotioniger CBS 115572 TaxID=1450535 RepID=A0A317WZQ3_9EURO|nr:hypothetical protein BO94DRAFT_381087 [Aspergillus sclerotioniger CBS 115572]PWY91833.1 hypothetical protein BO94DRAFT_381087 [Aspergillus sclerotioniger CBS 115572]
MNNDQFRRLVLDNPTSKPTKTSPDGSSTSHEQRNSIGGATPAGALGSRLRSNIPMTPRSLTNVDFARQLAEYRREAQPAPKRFKSSAAPKGTKLPTGYQDRAALLRQQEDEAAEGNDLEKRVKALEEMVKLGQIDQATFEKLRGDMGVGGDLGSTHMVKGLDWALLKRVKEGEDVSEVKEKVEEKEEVDDLDDELDKVLGEKGEGVDALPDAPKEKEKKKGSMAPPPQKKSRDEILKELKASRAAAAAAAAEAKAAELALGTKFKRIGSESKVEKKRWVEQDENGRRKEILQITDAEGKTKRKVRWLDKPGEAGGTPAGLLVPDKDAKPLGMEVPAEFASKAAPPPEEEDDDIFAGVGDDYNPLGDIGDDDDSSDESEDGEVVEKPARTAEPASANDTKKPAETTSRPRNYFSTSTTDEVPEVDRSNPLAKDPTLLAALKRAAALRQSEEAAADAEDVDSETALRRKKFLEEARRREALDAMDMDMGFGGSRNEDEEDDEEVVLETENRGGKKRKRGPKKKKGDKDSAADVMSVLEGRKKE